MKKKIDLDLKAIGQRMRKHREALELSREEFAEIIELSDYYVGQLERGERQMSLNVLVKIANCLHISLDYLIFGQNTSHSYYTPNIPNIYKTKETNEYEEIKTLLDKCSTPELKLIKQLLKTIIPYLRQ